MKKYFAIIGILLFALLVASCGRGFADPADMAVGTTARPVPVAVAVSSGVSDFSTSELVSDAQSASSKPALESGPTRSQPTSSTVTHADVNSPSPGSYSAVGSSSVPSQTVSARTSSTKPDMIIEAYIYASGTEVEIGFLPGEKPTKITVYLTEDQSINSIDNPNAFHWSADKLNVSVDVTITNPNGSHTITIGAPYRVDIEGSGFVVDGQYWKQIN